jgi:hypothetical protein
LEYPKIYEISKNRKKQQNMDKKLHKNMIFVSTAKSGFNYALQLHFPLLQPTARMVGHSQEGDFLNGPVRDQDLEGGTQPASACLETVDQTLGQGVFMSKRSRHGNQIASAPNPQRFVLRA